MLLTNISHFDKPVNYSRVGYNNGELDYFRANLPNLEQHEDFMRLYAVPDRVGTYRSGRLVTEHTHALTAPFSVSTEARWSNHSMAFFCPMWLFPYNRNRVNEIDGVEWHAGDHDYITLTHWWTGNCLFPKDVGTMPYNKAKKSQKRVLFDCPVTDGFNKYEIRVERHCIEWRINDVVMKTRLFFVGGEEFYLRSTVQVATWAYNQFLPEITLDNPATMDIKYIEIL